MSRGELRIVFRERTRARTPGLRFGTTIRFRTQNGRPTDCPQGLDICLPDADNATVAQKFIALACEVARKSRALNDVEKLERTRNRRLVRRKGPQPFSRERRVSRSDTKSRAGDWTPYGYQEQDAKSLRHFSDCFRLAVSTAPRANLQSAASDSAPRFALAEREKRNCDSERCDSA